MMETIILVSGVFIVIGFLYVPVKATYDTRKTERCARGEKGQS